MPQVDPVACHPGAVAPQKGQIAASGAASNPGAPSRLGLLRPEPTFPIADPATRNLNVRILPPYKPAS
jgi:hypothetical protein